MRPVLLSRLTVWAALLAASACSSEAASPLLLTTDSAGVTVRQISDATPPPEYRLSDPLWVVGGAGAPPASELFGVVGAVMLSGGEVVIANAGTRELKLFDPAGAHVRTVGGDGEGPGEFRGIDLVGRLNGDSILTFDWRQNRLQIFDETLELGRLTVVPVPESLGSVGINPVAVFPDGRFLARGAMMVQEYPREARLHHVFLMDPSGEIVDSIGPLPGGRTIWMSGEKWPLFERKAGFAVHAGSIYTGTSESSEFRRLSLDGQAAEIVRGGLTSRPPRQADIDQAQRGQMPTGVGEAWVSDLLPFWSDYFVDETGAVWRSRHPAPDATELTWLIVEAEGRGVGALTTPARFTPLHAAGDWVLAVEKDSLDIERVSRYPLRR